MLTELRTIWSGVIRVRIRLFFGTFYKFSFLHRQNNDSSSSSLSSLLNKTNSTMQHWPTLPVDKHPEKSTNNERSFTLCELCLEPSNSVMITDIYNSMRHRLSSEPVPVPDSLTTTLIDSQRQPGPSNSSGYESGFGNGLSPTSNSWTLGVNDISSFRSITSDDLPSDQDSSVFDDASLVNGPDDQSIDDDDDSFEVLSFEAAPESTLYIKEFQYTTPNGQNNACSCCNTPFTPAIPPRRCHYYGRLYCPRCHINDQAYIPAKIIKSFDMRLYSVCRRAKYILQLNIHQPIFDIPIDNENLYVLVPILNEIKTLRLQFQHFYAYLSTCKRIGSDLNELFFKEFYARDYLYQSVHLYSINDLLALKKVLQTLQQASQRARQHIYQCPICREKGFTCEICKKRNDILYPFDEPKTIGQCQACSNLYHKQCWENIEHDCPKCYRLIHRRHELTYN